VRAHRHPQQPRGRIAELRIAAPTLRAVLGASRHEQLLWHRTGRQAQS